MPLDSIYTMKGVVVLKTEHSDKYMSLDFGSHISER